MTTGKFTKHLGQS